MNMIVCIMTNIINISFMRYFYLFIKLRWLIITKARSLKLIDVEGKVEDLNLHTQFSSRLLAIKYKHDELYNKWWDYFDRRIADIYLLKFMWQDCLRIRSNFKRFYYFLRCLIYYIAVRLFWKKYFIINN